MTVVNNPRGWKWFFGVLFVLTLAASTSLIVYNWRQQLRPETLEANWRLWDEKGPKSYRLVYTQRFTSAGGQDSSNEYEVTVKDRKVTEVIINGIPKTERLEYHDMGAIFREIETFQEQDRKEKRKVYCVADFDPSSGAVGKYVRRVMGSSQRQMIEVKSLTPR